MKSQNVSECVKNEDTRVTIKINLTTATLLETLKFWKLKNFEK